MAKPTALLDNDEVQKWQNCSPVFLGVHLVQVKFDWTSNRIYLSEEKESKCDLCQEESFDAAIESVGVESNLEAVREDMRNADRWTGIV